MKRTPLRKVSKNPRKVAQRKLYEKNKAEYLSRPSPNGGFDGKPHRCEKCGGLNWKIDLHHKSGRTGSSLNEDGKMEINMTNIATFMAVCRPCHNWIHAHPKESRELGYLT